MSKKLFLILCLLLTYPHLVKSNDEEPAEETPEEPTDDTEAETDGDEEELEAEEKAEEAEEEAEEGGAEYKCVKPILETYGMVGLDEPRPMALDMCELVKHSCCNATDQMKIYENWVEGGEDADLVERFKYQTRVRNMGLLGFISGLFGL